ncbi:DUF4279 domain-containing protein [Bradyrhizobium sp. SSUT112]|uniref:DUF4279 domain-containing protein n=1 Tax=Bradyrhizobium sp. SSUT112 TaxID=3040604 RepID=UPI00244B32E6|nr:DUF4279 domain-containing protein [Bradyrhizobium sp. SSUT112]MDH2352297.1 DUF4279 domain-containing protein [Bradyrhizobium sp. SSUT112]
MKNRISATLSIWSKQLDPEKISKSLDFEPDRAVARGADRIPPRPRPTAFGWHVTCVENDKEMAGDVLKLLCERIESIREKLPKLRLQDPEISVNLALHIAPKSADVSLFIDRYTIELISALTGDLDIEFFDI